MRAGSFNCRGLATLAGHVLLAVFGSYVFCWGVIALCAAGTFPLGAEFHDGELLGDDPGPPFISGGVAVGLCGPQPVAGERGSGGLFEHLRQPTAVFLRWRCPFCILVRHYL